MCMLDSPQGRMHKQGPPGAHHPPDRERGPLDDAPPRTRTDAHAPPLSETSGTPARPSQLETPWPWKPSLLPLRDAVN